MRYYSKEVGSRIKALRQKRNLTQVQLAEKLCYATERQLQRIENGDAICPVDRIVELAGILNTTTDYLLLGNEMNKRNIKDDYNTQIDGMYIVILRSGEG